MLKQPNILWKKSLIAAISIILVGCAVAPTERGRVIISAYPEMVSSCSLLGTVVGKSKLNWFTQGYLAAKYRALDEAARIGATHIVWGRTASNYVMQVEGDAYYCDPNKLVPDSYESVHEYLKTQRYPYDEPYNQKVRNH